MMADPDPRGAPAADWPCLSIRGENVRLALCVAPNARRIAADGMHDGALRVRLAAPPVDGKANEQLLNWLADELGLPRRALRLVRGETARRKLIEIDAAPAYVARWLAQCLGAAEAAPATADHARPRA